MFRVFGDVFSRVWGVLRTVEGVHIQNNACIHIVAVPSFSTFPPQLAFALYLSITWCSVASVFAPLKSLKFLNNAICDLVAPRHRVQATQVETS